MAQARSRNLKQRTVAAAAIAAGAAVAEDATAEVQTIDELRRSMTEEAWSEYVREHDKAQRREIANFYNLTSDPESLWGGTLVFLCRLHIMLGWFRAAFETIWDVDMD